MNSNDGNFFRVLTEKLKKDKKSLMIILIGIAGMLLIVLSEFTGEVPTDDNTEKNPFIYNSIGDRSELETLISKIDGAGKASVIITYECSKENIYARNLSENKEEKGDKKTEEYIIVDEGDDETGLIVKEIYPKVAGVAIVCQGGDSPTVKNEITMLIKALYNISSNNISITKMQK